MIYFDRVSKVYADDSVALDEVSFSVEPGEFISIVGHSGAGKTTLVKMLLAEERQAALDCALGAAQPDRQAHSRDALAEEMPKLVVFFLSPTGDFAAHDYPIKASARS